MKKVTICLVCSILAAMEILHAQDKPVQDTARKIADTAGRVSGAEIVRLTTDTVPKPVEAVVVENPASPATDNQGDEKSKKKHDNSASSGDGDKKDYDTRWWLSPFCKFQLQDFAMLEKNRKGYLSDANTLSLQGKGNMSFAASIYKNFTSRFSVSGDVGFSYGHVTSTSVLISQTKTKTFNLLNATIYYHLLAAKYRLQPFISLGINNLTNDQSYTSAPVGVGVKFHSKNIMLTGQAAYGYAVSSNIAPTVIYSVGMYLPLNNKKKKKADMDADSSAYNRPGKDDKRSKSDTTSKGGVTNNIFITINMDSVSKARKNGDSDGDDDGSQGGRRRGRRSGNPNDDAVAEDSEKLAKFDFQDFGQQDYRMDTLDGRPVIKFVVYFEFNEYALTSKAFSTVDKIIYQLHKNPNLIAEVKGYTDNVGTAEYNNFLSRKRAQTVFDYLNSKGIPSDKMSSQYFGKDNPVADNKDPNTAWLNRRAEIIVHVKDK